MGKRELVALLYLSSWCLVIVMWLFLTMPWVCLQFMIVVFPDYTHFLFFTVWVWIKQLDDENLRRYFGYRGFVVSACCIFWSYPLPFLMQLSTLVISSFDIVISNKIFQCLGLKYLRMDHYSKQRIAGLSVL